jgi:hypothetical protein
LVYNKYELSCGKQARIHPVNPAGDTCWDIGDNVRN